MKRIAIDCRLGGVRHAGIGRYIENLVRECVQRREVQWVLIFHDERQAAEVLPGKHAHVRRVYVPVRHYSFKEQLILPWVLWKERVHLLHVPHFNIPLLYFGTIVVTIHDLLWHEQRGTTVTTLPTWQYWLKYVGYRLAVVQAVRRARKIFVPTKSVTQTLKHYYPFASAKTVVTPEGVAPTYLSQVHKKTPVPKPKKQLVYTGSLYPHKNVKLIIQALPFLPDFTLLLVGSRSVFQKDVQKYATQQGLSQRVEFLGRLSDEEIIQLYQQSYALVAPSFSEGFGLPGLEAMAAGLPVVASDIPVFREVYASAAAYFDPYSVAELVETLHTLGPSRETLIRTGKKRVQQFSWSRMADQTYAGYQSVL